MDVSKLLAEIENLKVELEKFDRGNKSAGTRARKVCQAVKAAAQEIRVQIQEKKASL
jgi:hypothetical protein